MVYLRKVMKKVEKSVRKCVVFFPCSPSVGYSGGVVGGCGGPGEVVDMWVGGSDGVVVVVGGIIIICLRVIRHV
jgi:hypothetical protein